MRLARARRFNLVCIMCEPDIEGFCDPRFASVEEAFRKNFARRGEHGGSFAMVVEGETVVDLWGGWMDAERSLPWHRDTLVTTQSTTKGLVAALAHQLVQQGLLEWDAPVARYWPRFARRGKSSITVRQLISHQAGLCVLDGPLPAGTTLDWARMIDALEAQAPAWEPGSQFGYHAVTWGFLIGELLHRVTGTPLPRLFERRFAAPWGLDFHLGVHDETNRRVAQFLEAPPGRGSLPAGEPTAYRARTFTVSPPLPGLTPNSPAARAAPGNGFGNGRSIARFYGGLANGGVLDGVRLLAPQMVASMGESEVVGLDVVLGAKRRFGLGFWLHYPTRNAVRGARAFGHPGLGGSFGFADPDHRLGLGYAMNRPGAFLRAANLELAAYRGLKDG